MVLRKSMMIMIIAIITICNTLIASKSARADFSIDASAVLGSPAHGSTIYQTLNQGQWESYVTPSSYHRMKLTSTGTDVYEIDYHCESGLGQESSPTNTVFWFVDHSETVTVGPEGKDIDILTYVEGGFPNGSPLLISGLGVRGAYATTFFRVKNVRTGEVKTVSSISRNYFSVIFLGFPSTLVLPSQVVDQKTFSP